MNYLEASKYAISYNSVEGKAKDYVTSRKSYMFHNKEDGAKVSIKVLSIILLLMPENDFIQGHCQGREIYIPKNTRKLPVKAATSPNSVSKSLNR